nr:reverse transcriptase domain-containing protein [Tanacetum cinerariifolium]
MPGEHNITYRPRTPVKGQILADFLTEMPDENLPAAPVAETQQESWTLFTDGSSSSNNEAEYEALIAGLRITAQMGVQNVHVSVDSKLVANQVLGTYVAKKKNMIKYLDKVKSLVSGFTNFSISQVPRSKNKKADALSKIASTSFAHLSKQHVRGTTVSGGQSHTTRILLANDAPRRARHDTKMQRLSDTPPRNKKPPAALTSITAPWPFYKRGIDIAGPFPEGPGKVKFLIVAMDYFTKWIEAKAVATITGGQFSDNPFKDWCDKLNITQRFALVKHPQSNGLVERANRNLREGIKARLGEGNKNWVEELPHVLWAHRTMIKSIHGDTPFSLTYETEAVIPAEIGMPTYRTAAVDVVYNDEELRLNLDLLDERRDFVYRSNEASHAVAGGKLGPKWEGPYKVTEALGDGAYKLRSTDETILSRTWNIANLKRCYL